MITFTISDDNNITAYPSAEEARAEAGSTTFDSAATLADVSAEWPASRLVEIWNSIPGNTPVKKFENRKKALGRIWKGIQGLAGAAQPKAANPAKPVKTPKKAKAAKKAAPKKQAAKTTGDRTNKKAEVIAMMKRAKGATLPEIMEATGWQAHTVRGFVSILGGKGGQTIESSKDASGERRYKITK
jgi:hypothetical protein